VRTSWVVSLVVVAGLLAPVPAQAAPAPLPTAPVASPGIRPAPVVVPPSPITFAFGGDTHFERGLVRYAVPGTRIPELTRLLGSADISMLNLETAVTTRGTPQAKKWRFRVAPVILGTLASSGVDLVSMANNHSADYGAVGVADSIAARAAYLKRIGVVGFGRNVTDAFAPWVRVVRGTRVAVFGATSITDLTTSKFPATSTRAGVASIVSSSGLTRLLTGVRREHARGSVVVVFLHWGDEHVSVPNSHQKSIAAALVRAGAQVVVGSHAHELQGAGRMGGSVVAYGMGNFVWYHRATFVEGHSGVLHVTVTGGRVTSSSFTATATGADNLPHPDSAALARAERARLGTLTRRAGLSPLR
jgi:poly-gamma-glutamate capsule biosynthesis protein CapA/YwtB (metallophosphatase superfamily)